LGGYALESQAREVLHGLGFKDYQMTATWALSRADGKCVLRWHGPARNAGLLLMDEPTNHLDIDPSSAEQFLEVISWRAAHDFARRSS